MVEVKTLCVDLCIENTKLKNAEETVKSNTINPSGIKPCKLPHNSEHCPLNVPENELMSKICRLIRAGIASNFKPSAGRANAWITSADEQAISLFPLTSSINPDISKLNISPNMLDAFRTKSVSKNPIPLYSNSSGKAA